MAQGMPMQGMPMDEGPQETAADTSENTPQDNAQDMPKKGLLASAGEPMSEPTEGPSEYSPANLTPVERKAFDMAMNQIKALVYAKDVFKNVLESIKLSLKGDIPFAGLSTVVANAMSKIKTDSLKAKVDLSDNVMLAVGAEMIGDLATMVHQAKVYTFPQGMIDGAYIRAVTIYQQTEQKAGRIDVAAHKAKFQQMVAEDKNGTLAAKLGLNRHQRRGIMRGK